MQSETTTRLPSMSMIDGFELDELREKAEKWDKQHPVARLLNTDEEAQRLFHSAMKWQGRLRAKAEPKLKEEKHVAKTESGLVYPATRMVPDKAHGDFFGGSMSRFEEAMWKFIKHMAENNIHFEEYT
jgi:hypothetical protein